MPGIGSLHGVHGERANRIDAFHFDRTGGVLDGDTGFCCTHSGSFVALGLSVNSSESFSSQDANSTLVQNVDLRKWRNPNPQCFLSHGSNRHAVALNESCATLARRSLRGQEDRTKFLLRLLTSAGEWCNHHTKLRGSGWGREVDFHPCNTRIILKNGIGCVLARCRPIPELPDKYSMRKSLPCSLAYCESSNMPSF